MAHSLRYWLAIGFSALIGLSILTVVAVLLGVLLPRLNAEVEAANRNIGVGISRQADEFLGNAARNLSNLVRELAAASVDPGPDLRMRIDTLAHAVDPLEAIYVIDPDDRVVDVGLGAERRRQRDEQVGLDFSQRPFVAQSRLTGRVQWSDTYLSTRGRIVVAVAVPWRRTAGERTEAWTLVGELDLAHLSRQMEAIGALSGVLPIVVDRRGHVVAHPSPGVALRQENLAHLELVAASRNGKTGTGILTLDRAEYLGTTLPITGPGWSVLVARPAGEAYATVRSTLRSLAIGTALALALALAIAWGYGRRLTRRVAEFSGHVHAIAAGDYGAPLPTSRAEELNDLADSMRKMARAVLDREARMKESEARFRDVANASADWIWEVDAAGRYTYASDTVRTLLGYAPEEIIGRTAFDLMPPDEAPRIREAFGKIVAQGLPFRDLENIVVDSLGRRHVTLTSGTPRLDDAGRVVGYRGVDRDVTAQRRAEAEQRLAASVFAASTEGICITDEHGTIVSVNPALLAMTGFSADEVVGQTPRIFQSGRHDAAFYGAMWERIAASGSWSGEIWNRRRNGEVFPEWLSITVVRDGAGRVSNYIGTFSDITDRKQAEEEMRFLAHHDPLTRLPNRTLLDDRIRQAIAKARRHGDHVAVLFLDLDRFKLINDTLGHDVGDRLLAVVAGRLGQVLRETETVARLGGDEFIVVIPDLADVDRAAIIARKLVDVLGEPLEVDGNVMHITTSIGLSIFPEDGHDGATLLRNADTAMYHAKESGRNTFKFYTAAMNQAVQERVSTESDLRGALERGEFQLYYQPQVDSRSGRIIGMEALIRWMHPQRGLVPPDRFIPIAEETGLIVPIGRWVLEEACRQGRRWHDAGQHGLRIGVNLSARQFVQADLHAQVLGALDASGLPADALELELTESMLMDDPDAASETLQHLGGLGVRLAIDDFGTGYSSLAYLKRFPVSRLKIDRSFVRDLSSDPNDAAIVSAVVAMAGSLRMEVIAEGVETPEQLHYLEAHGCTAIQGYLFSRPRPASEFERFSFDRVHSA